MANQVTIPLYEDIISGYKGPVASENDNIQAARKKGFDSFKKLGFPTRRNEDWKYTPVTTYLQEHYHVNGVAKAYHIPQDLLKEAGIPGMDCYPIVLVNGQLQPLQKEFPAFIKISSLKEAQQDAAFAEYFAKNTDVEHQPFAALNTALFSNGLFLQIEANTIADKPLHIVHLFTTDSNLLVQPRHLLIVKRSAALSVIETVISNNEHAKIFANTLTEIFIEENANLDHYVLQTAKSGVRLINHTEVGQKRHSLFNSYTFSLPSADLIRNNLNVSLNDVDTESHLFGLYLGTNMQLIDNHTLVNHRMPNCNSNEIYKGVLADNATGVFNGKIFVQHDAQKTNAFQQNNNLLLSNKASINSKPQLEIFADDVKCSHGSTVGQLSKEAMFYLQSRGIGEQAAKALLINAFAFDVTEKIKIPQLQKHINKLIAKHIPVNEKINHAE